MTQDNNDSQNTQSDDVYRGAAMPLTQHLREFRDRLIYALVALVITTLASSIFAGRFLIILERPLRLKPQAITPTETIITYFKVSLVLGIALAMPVILYQIVAYLTPALTKREKRYLYIFLPAGTLLFILGLSFATYIALPAALRFLQYFGQDYAEIQWTLSSYVSFVTTVLIWNGIGFQTPLVIFFIAKLGIVGYDTLRQNIRWAFLISAVLAAIITPTPDPFNMLIVMLPLFLLYIFGVFLARFA